MADLHAKTEFGEWCVPVSRQFSLLMVKASLSSCKVEGLSVDPKMRIEAERWLKLKEETTTSIRPYLHGKRVILRLGLSMQH